MSSCTFALFFGNRGFFPESLIAGARNEMSEVLEKLGHKVLMLPEDVTRFGAVETPQEGEKYAAFLKEHSGKYDGVILCLPNFGDETGAVAALQDAGVPILIHAYPDEIDKMDFAHRRDSFCGKFSVMDVFTQYQLPFTAFKPHTVHPKSGRFAEQIEIFAATCRVVKGMQKMIVGGIGARTTAFKTVRFDEITLQKYGITTEILDLSEVIQRVKDKVLSDQECKIKSTVLKNYTSWKGVPDDSFNNLVKLGVVIDEIIDEYKMDALSIRCWIELEKQLKIAPCVLLGELNDRGIPAACELDVCNAIAMYALSLATQSPATCLDWNNNWGEEEDKCILFHCGPVPQSLMKEKGQVIDHPMFAKALGAGCGFGPNVGRIKATPFTFASSVTKNGLLEFCLGEGRFTEDIIPEEFFGCAGVAEIKNLQDKLLTLGYGGYRHHVSVSPGNTGQALKEAFSTYLGYEVLDFAKRSTAY
ncbi:MAG: L-fucose/L-arabinose isomerase family protein [Lentisphaerae bacterium]|nr:L-fucose/L-arabinose isomerase family protein [Lentisphaerota bacterium]